MRVEAKGHNYRIGRHHKLAAVDRHRAAASLGIRLTQPGAQQANAVNPSGIIQGQRHRLHVKFKGSPFFPGIFDLLFRPRHVGLIPTVGAGDAGSPMAQRGAHAVHRRIAAAQHYHVQPGGIDKGFRH